MKMTESETSELKEIYTSAIKKDIVAFANSKGGTLYIGVRDDGWVTGLDQVDLVMEQLTNSIRDGIRPDLSLFTETQVLSDQGKSVIKVTVQQGTERPYYLAEKGLRPSGVYLRNGTSSAPASESSIRALIKTRDGDSFESNPAIKQELTFQTLTGEFDKRNLAFSEVQMENLGLLTRDGIYTNLGMLVSDQCPHSIKLAVFQGVDKNLFKDRNELTGSLLTQLADTYRLIDFYNGTKATFHDLLRTDRRDYPQDALREVLLNALIHRDYSFSGSTLINLFSDRLEIISLGGLVPGLSLEAALMGASQSRNQQLAALFYRMKLVEAYGTGISKILNAYEKTDFLPLFESVEGAFKVTLPNLNQAPVKSPPADFLVRETLRVLEEERYAPLLNLFDRQITITRKDVEESMGIKTTHAINWLKELLDKGILLKVGKGKNTRYLRNPARLSYQQVKADEQESVPPKAGQ